MNFSRGLLIAVSLAIGASVSHSQTPSAQLSGLILDPSSAVVPGVVVLVTNLENGFVRRAVSGVNGQYVVPLLQEGAYRLDVSADGFQAVTRSGIRLELNQAVRVDFTLDFGAVIKTLEVFADASPLNFENATREEGISPEVIQDLPLIVSGGPRNAANFAVLAPGVNTGGGEPEAFRARINGGLQSGDEAIMDGVSMQQGTMSQSGMISFWDFPMSPDMVAEFKILTSNYEPQYGSTTSAQIIVTTKSGSNEFHGGGYEYHRNTLLNARQFGTDERPKDIEHDAGGFLSGPLKLPGIHGGDRQTFFYFNYEAFRIAGGLRRPTLSIPSLRERQGDFSDWKDADGNLIPIFDPLTTRSDAQGNLVRDPFHCGGQPNAICPSRFSNSLAAQWLDLLPNPTNNQPLNNYQAPTPVPDVLLARTDYYMTRIDHYLSDRDHFSFSLWHQTAPPNFDSLLPQALADEVFSSPQNSWLLRMNHDHVFGPGLINHFAWGFLNRNESYGSVNFQAAAGLPRIPGAASGVAAPKLEFSDGFAAFGNENGDPAGNKTRRPSWVFNDLVTWVRGSHTWKFGGEYRRLGQVFNGNQNTAGTFSFARGSTGLLNLNSGSPIASFLLEMVDSGNVDFRSVNRWVARSDAYVAHLGDVWRITPALTLSLGVRWDMFRPTWEESDHLAFFDPLGLNPAAGRPGRLAFAGSAPRPESFGRRFPEDVFKTGFAPRIGLALAFDDRTVLRTGYGIFFTQAFYPEWNGGMALDGFNANVAFSSALGGLQPAFLLSEGFPQNFEAPPYLDASYRNGQDLSYRPFDANRRPNSQQWNFTLERQIGPDAHVSVAYVGNKGTRLPSKILPLNALDPALLGMGEKLFDEFQPGTRQLHGVPLPYDGWVEQMTGCAPSVAQALLPFPQYCSALSGLNENAGNSTYHSLQAKIEKRFSSGTFLLASYTWSKLLTGSGHVDEVANTWSGITGVISPFERHRNKSLAQDDVPHVFKLSMVYEVPFGPQRRHRFRSSFLNALLGQWSVSGIFRTSSGIPFFFRSSQCNIPGPFRMGCIPAVLPGESPFAQDKNDFEPGRPLFRRAAFEPIESFNFYAGQGARISGFRAFGFQNLDIALFKDISLGEKLHLQLRGEFFNAMNWHHFVASGSTLRGGVTAFDNDLASPSFGLWNGQVSSPRNIQVGARLEF
jgi:hypothetical protein